MTHPRPIADRFWEKVGPVTATGCREWQGAPFEKGYGALWIADRDNRNRFVYPRGEAHVSSRLTAIQVAEIRQQRKNGRLLKDIAADFGITKQTVSKIARNERWTA